MTHLQFREQFVLDFVFAAEDGCKWKKNVRKTKPTSSQLSLLEIKYMNDKQ
jgi:hypothetical protein